jgi:hypothetical protein
VSSSASSEDKDITEITRNDARAFVSKLEEGKYSPESVRKRSGILRALTAWASVELELSDANPFTRLGIVKPIGSATLA